MRKSAVGVLLACALLVAAPSAQASSFVYDINYVFSGCKCPSTVTATFTDVAGGVQLTLDVDSSALSGGYVSKWYFNFLGADPSQLLITNQSGITAAVGQQANGFKADGDGYFDLRFDFASGQLSPGNNSVWLITGTDLTADDFIDISVNGPSRKTGFYAAVHMQGPTGSHAWLADRDGPRDIDADPDPPPPVPEPLSILLFGVGLVGLAPMRKRLRRTSTMK